MRNVSHVIGTLSLILSVAQPVFCDQQILDAASPIVLTLDERGFNEADPLVLEDCPNDNANKTVTMPQLGPTSWSQSASTCATIDIGSACGSTYAGLSLWTETYTAPVGTIQTGKVRLSLVGFPDNTSRTCQIRDAVMIPTCLAAGPFYYTSVLGRQLTATPCP